MDSPRIRLSDQVDVTAIVTAYRRIDQTIESIGRIQRSTPAPREILVHVDGNQVDCANAIRTRFPSVRVILSEQNIGPGGGRNLLMARARCSYVASFDDDSYPLQLDYFQRIVEIFTLHPDASILAATIVHQGEPLWNEDMLEVSWVASFVGCGCVYRRRDFDKTNGYVPLVVAYGMEEVDLALRIIRTGGKILFTPALRVFHDTDRSHHSDPKITAYSIANIALLVFLRYPISYWPFGIAQLVRRIFWLIKVRRLRGILEGLLLIPRHILEHRAYRATIDSSAFRRFLALRKKPELVSMGHSGVYQKEK